MPKRARHIVRPAVTGHEDAPPATPPAPPATPPATPPAGFLTQEQVNQIAAREKDQGRVAALREVSEMLGGMRVEDAAELVKAAKAADDANKTQAQRDAEAAATARAEAEAERKAAAEDRHAARLERALTAAGAVDVEVATAAIKVGVDADADAIKTAVDALKQRVPGLFGTPTSPPSDPGTPPPSQKTTPSGWDAGKAEAERRYGKTA